MIVIDIGSPAINRAYGWDHRTIVAQTNPANESGTITSVEIWANTNMTGVEVATFYVVSGNNLSTRDTHAIGDVTGGSKQTFSGLSIDVQVGDYIGMWYATGELEVDVTGGTGVWAVSDIDLIPCTNHTFTSYASYAFSLYGTGETSAAEDNAIFFGSNF